MLKHRLHVSEMDQVTMETSNILQGDKGNQGENGMQVLNFVSNETIWQYSYCKSEVFIQELYFFKIKLHRRFA